MTILTRLKRIFRAPFRSFTIDNKFTLQPAFEFNGERFYMFNDFNEGPTGRMLAALAVYDEMSMRTSREYLELHCQAVERILSDPKKINIGALAQINKNLQERLQLMLLPEFVYKLASVLFLSENENPYTYDYEFNAKKIERWKGAGMELDFFLKTPLKTLVPELDMTLISSKQYLGVAAQIDLIHRQLLTDQLSEKQ